MKKINRDRKKLIAFSTSVLGVLFASIAVSVPLSVQQWNSSHNNNTKSIDNNVNASQQEVSKENKSVQEQLATLANESNFSKEINAELSFTNEPARSGNKVVYVNGFDRPILEVWVQNSDIYARCPSPIKIQNVNNKTEVNASNFLIAVSTYPNSPYTITGQNNGYKLNQPSTTHVSWDVHNETYLNPYNKNTTASSYVEFNSLNSQPQIIGSVKDGYAELRIKIKLPKIPPVPKPNDTIEGDTYFGPNIIDIQKGNSYSSYLGIKNQRNGPLDKVLIDDTIIFTQFDDGQIIYNNNSNNFNTEYVTKTGGLSSSNLITASEYLNKLSSLPVSISGAFYNNEDNTKNSVLAPKIYGYADDANGRLTIVTFDPYQIKGGKLVANDPKIFTLDGFKKTNNIIGTKKLILNSSEINFINHTESAKYSVSTAQSKDNAILSQGFLLSPFQCFDFAIEGGNIVVRPNSRFKDLFVNSQAFNASLSSRLDWTNFIKSSGSDIGVFDKLRNARSFFLQTATDYDTYYKKFNYNSGKAILLSSIIGAEASSSAISNIFQIKEMDKYEGPWVIADANNTPEYVNVIEYLRQHDDIYPSISNLLNQKISLQNLTQDNKFIEIKKMFGTALPKIISMTDFSEYLNLINTYSIYHGSGTAGSSVLSSKHLVNDNLIFFENGPVIMRSWNSKKATDAPYLIDPTNVFVWDDYVGNTNLSLESNTIFSSLDNLNYNLDLLRNGDIENFGKTTFSVNLEDNAGIGNVSNILPSDFLSDENNYKRLTINAYNSLIANEKNSKITLIADDENGRLQVNVSPLLVTTLSDGFKIHNIDTIEEFNKMTSSQMASLLNTTATSNTNDQYFSFVINGFKKTTAGGGSTTPEPSNEFNSYPLAAFTTSSIIGTDLEANLEKFKNSPAEYNKFESFIIADALQKLKQKGLIHFFNPTGGSSDLLTSNKTLDENNFAKVIARFNLKSSEKYNLYVYEVWFKPSTLKDFNNNFNLDEVKITLNISTTGEGYNSWVTNNYISTGLSEAYKALGKQSPLENGTISNDDFVKNFADVMTNVIPVSDDVSLIRYYQNGKYYNAANKQQPSNNVTVTLPSPSGTTYEIYPKATTPIIYSYDSNYGFDYNANGSVIAQNYKNSIQDIGNWTFTYSQVSSINDGSITLTYQPSIWMENGKFITNGIEEQSITFGDIIEKNGITTALSDNKLSAYDTNATPKTIYDAISAKSSPIYDEYLTRIKNLITNALPLPNNPSIQGETIVELRVPNKYKWTGNGENASEETKQAWREAQSDGMFQVEVWISGQYFDNSFEPITASEPILLGTVNIINLQKAKITRFNNSYTIPNINSYGLVSNLSEYFWLQANKVSNQGLTWIRINELYNNSDFEQLLTSGLIIDGVENSTSLQINAPSISIESVNNADGSLVITKNNAKYIGEYYNEFGIKETTSGISSTEDITINGFQKIEDTATKVVPSSGEVSIPSLQGMEIASINEEIIRDALISNNIIQNFPILRYGDLGSGLTEQDLIKIQIVNKNSAQGKITFSYQIKGVITDEFTTPQGKSRKIVAIENLNPNFTNELFLSGELTIKDLKSATSADATAIQPTGASTELFSNEIATYMFSQNNIQLNNWYDASNPYAKKIINIIGQYNIIYNVPEDFNENNVQIKINRVDNTIGQIEIEIKLNYFQYFENGQLKIYKGPEFQVLPNNANRITILGGFKTISGETSLKSDIQNNGLTISSNLKPSDVNNADQWKSVIFSLLPSIFDNLPTLSSTQNSNLNLPTITQDDLVISVVDATNLNDIVLNVSLKSYFTQDQNYQTIIWNKQDKAIASQAKDFGNIRIKGLDAVSNTEFVSNIYITPSDKAFYNILASDVYDNISTYNTSLIQIIMNRGLTGKIPETLNTNNLKITSVEEYNNLDGTLTINVSLDHYWENNQEILPIDGKVKKGTIVVGGFRTIKPTTIETEYNGSLNVNINSKYTYEFTTQELQQLVYDSLISNVPSDFSIEDISIKSNVRYNNKTGTIIFVPIIKNYYDELGILKNTSKEFGQVIVTGFKKVTAKTIIDEINYVSGEYRNSLAISMLNFASSNSIVATEKLKTYILENMISNAPFITTSDIDVTGISVNNITGTIDATVSLKKYINSDYIVVDSNQGATPLTQNISIRGFLSVGATNIASNLIISSQFSNMGATEFAKDNEPELKKFIFNNIQNKWSTKENSFTENDFSIYKVVPNNVTGQITLQVGLRRYIDQNGQYNAIKTGEYPYLIDVTIKGFKPVNSSMIETAYTIPSQQDNYAHDYISSEAVKTTLSEIIFNNLLINKISTTTANDIKVIELKANNQLGTIEAKVRWTNNYIDYRGLEVTDGSGNGIEQEIVFSGFKPMDAPTSIVQNIEITNLIKDASSTLPSEYANVSNDETANQSQRLNEIKKIIIDNLVNEPQKYNFKTHEYETLITPEDINVINKTMSDNSKYYGSVNNFDGTLVIEFTLDKYYNNSFDYVDTNESPNSIPLTLTTTFIGFKKTDKHPTQIRSWLNLQTDFSNDPNSWNYVPEVNTFREETAKQITINENLVYVLLKSGIITNWIPLYDALGIPPTANENQYHEALKNSDEKLLLALRSKISVSITSRKDTSITLQIRVIDFVSNVDGIEVKGQFSNPYYVELQGLKDVNPTYIEPEVAVGDQILKQNITNYKAGTKFSEMNVFDILDNDINIIVWSQIKNIVKGLTPTIEKVADASVYEMSNFIEYFNVRVTRRNGYSGTIELYVELSSYYDVDEQLIDNTIETGRPKSGTVILTGFKRTSRTTINKYVTLPTPPKNLKPNEVSESPQRLLDIIISNKDLFFKDLPSLDTLGLEKAIQIDILDFNNLNGTVRANISLTHYFDQYGEYIEGNGKLYTQQVDISGFETTQPTSLINEISIQKLGLNNIFLEDITTPNVIDVIKNALIYYQNGEGISTGNTIWKNLPNNDQNISSLDFNLSINPNTINFSLGTAILDISMNEYYNDKGVFVDNEPKVFKTSLTGFKTISGPTKVSELASATGNGIDMSKTIIANYTVSDLIDNKLSNVILSTIDNKMLNMMFDNLPSNVNSNNIIDLSIVEGESNKEEGVLYVDIVLNNYFKQVSEYNIVQSHEASSKFRVKLSGFRKVLPTSVVSDQAIDVSEYLGDSTLFDIKDNEVNILTPILNQEEIKNKMLLNPYIDPTTGNIQTRIYIEPIKQEDKNGPEGTIKLTLKLRNYYQQTENGVVLNNTDLSQPFTVTLTGFKKLSTTEINKDLLLTTKDATIKASEYASDKAKVLQFLEMERKKIFTSGYNEVKIMDVVNPNINSISDYDKDIENRNKLFVDDEYGEIKLRIIYTGGYNEHADLNTERILSDVITITNFARIPTTIWNKLSDQSNDQENNTPLFTNLQTNVTIDDMNMDVVTIYDPRLNNLQANDRIPLETPGNYLLNYCIKETGGTLSFDLGNENWSRDNTNGTASIIVRVNGWKSKKVGDNKNFNKDSISVVEEAKNIKLVVTGYKSSNLKQTQTNMIIILSLTGGLVLLIIILLLVFIICRRRMV